MEYFNTSTSYSGYDQYINTETDEFGNTSTSNFNTVTGLLQSSTDANGNTTSYVYDDFGRLTTLTNGSNQVSYGYTDSNGVSNGQLDTITVN